MSKLKIAKINQSNIVEEIILVSEKNSLDKNGNVSGDVAINYLKNIIKNCECYNFICIDFHKCKFEPTRDWVYCPDEDCFRRPRPENINHTLIYDEETTFWREPVILDIDEVPPDGYKYIWDEDLYQSDNTKGWILVEAPPLVDDDESPLVDE